MGSPARRVMTSIRIFISSVQREFAQERNALRDFLQHDRLMRLFFDVFLFEDVPASDRRPDALYLDEVEQSDLYVGLFGNDYGTEDEDGISPTEREFDQATASGIHRLIFVKGTDNSIRDQAVDFVLSKIALSVGTRAESTQAPVSYEIPKEVVTEAIVNAVAHRDYTDNASIQVMLFSDRLEVLNPGRLPPTLTLEQLRDTHQSVPYNRLLARSLYLNRYIEEMGTGTLDMIRRCRDASLPEPEFTDTSGFKTTIWRGKPPEQIKVQPEPLPGDLKSKVLNILADSPMSRSELSKKLGQKEVSGQLKKVFQDLLTDEMIEYTLPETPRSTRQKFRLTDKGRTELSNLKSEKAD